MAVRKVGIEEELLLVDPETSQLAAVAQAAVSANEAEEEVAESCSCSRSRPPQRHPSTVTSCWPACGQDVVRSVRQRPPPESAPWRWQRPCSRKTHEDFTPTPRYRKIKSEYGEMARQALVCGMHVHVDVSSDDEAVRVVDGVRPWLPLLVAIAANSPYWQGVDTGHASWRSQVWSRWPTAGPAEAFGDVATYRQVSEQMIAWGGGLDPGDALLRRPARERLPHGGDPGGRRVHRPGGRPAGCPAGARVVTAAATDPSPPLWRGDLLRVASYRAARHGLSTDLVHPTKAILAPPREVFEAAVEHVRPVLEEAGDLDLVQGLFEQLLARGNGSTRQRQVFEATGSPVAVVEDLARRTEESWA